MGMFEVLGTMVDALDRAGITHMISGSVASARHGEARATQDIDIVIDPTPEELEVLLHVLGATDMYVGDGRAALSHRSQFNVIDTRSGWKVDLIIRRDRPFSVEELNRRRPVLIGGVQSWIASAEDCILSKLEWAKDSGSERQIRDVRSLVSVQGDVLDFDYLQRWALDLGVDELLDAVLRDAGS